MPLSDIQKQNYYTYRQNSTVPAMLAFTAAKLCSTQQRPMVVAIDFLDRTCGIFRFRYKLRSGGYTTTLYNRRTVTMQTYRCTNINNELYGKLALGRFDQLNNFVVQAHDRSVAQAYDWHTQNPADWKVVTKDISSAYRRYKSLGSE